MNTVKKTRFLSGAFFALLFATVCMLFGAVSVSAATRTITVTYDGLATSEVIKADATKPFTYGASTFLNGSDGETFKNWTISGSTYTIVEGSLTKTKVKLSFPVGTSNITIAAHYDKSSAMTDISNVKNPLSHLTKIAFSPSKIAKGDGLSNLTLTFDKAYTNGKVYVILYNEVSDGTHNNQTKLFGAAVNGKTVTFSNIGINDGTNDRTLYGGKARIIGVKLVKSGTKLTLDTYASTNASLGELDFSSSLLKNCQLTITGGDPVPSNIKRKVTITYDGIVSSEKVTISSEAYNFTISAPAQGNNGEKFKNWTVSGTKYSILSGSLTSRTVKFKFPAGTSGITVAAHYSKSGGSASSFTTLSKEFAPLKAYSKKTTKTSVTLKWSKVPGANSYIVYGNKNSGTFKKLKQTSATSFVHKGLKKGTYYKYYVVAVRGNDGLSKSKTVYVATTGGKYTNYKSFKLNKTKITLSLSRKKSFNLKVKSYTKVKKGKTVRKLGGAKIWFEDDNPGVISFGKNGKVTAKKTGTATIYAYTQNGVYKKITVTVKP